MYDEVDLEKSDETDYGEYTEDNQEQEEWVRDFCRHAPNKALCEWLEGQAMEIYKEQGREPFEPIATP